MKLNRDYWEYENVKNNSIKGIKFTVCNCAMFYLWSYGQYHRQVSQNKVSLMKYII